MTPDLSRRQFVAGAGAGALAAAAPADARKPRRKPKPSSLPSPDSIRYDHAADLELVEAVSLLRARRLSSAELTNACLERIEQRDGAINAWVRVYADLGREQADAADRRLANTKSGRRAPMVCGIPIGLKDLYAVKGLPLTASSRVLEGNIAPGNCTVWERLAAAGMVLLGHNQCDEFAFGAATPQTGNPWDTSRSPGGSSGGSGAALAARMVPAAPGTDTGGSVRIPASFCGVSALKPTAGRISTYGVIPLTWGRDTAGPMARSLRDVSVLLGAMQGRDERDAATFAAPAIKLPLAARRGAKPLTGVRFGIPRNLALPEGLAKPWAEFLDALGSLGATRVEYNEPPGPTGATPVGLTAIDRVENALYHQQFRDRIHLYRPDRLPAMLEISSYTSLPAADYVEHQRWRARFAAQWGALFTGFDFVVKPGATVDGVSHTELGDFLVVPGTVAGDYHWANHAGLPVITTPIGASTATNLPFGAQIGGPPHSDGRLLQVGIDYQARFPHYKRAPKSLP